MKKHVFSLLALILLTTCAPDTTTYYLETDDARGITEGAEVFRQGVKIGEVTDVEFADSDVRLTLETDSPLYRGQDFTIKRGSNDQPVIELGQPYASAEELAPGGVLYGERIGVVIPSNFEEALKQTIEQTIGENSAQLELSIKDLFGEDGEKLRQSIENVIGKDGERLQESIENIIGKDGEKLEAEFEKFFGENGERLEAWGKGMERWGADFGLEFEELGREIEQISERHPKGSAAWDREVKKALEKWADSKD